MKIVQKYTFFVLYIYFTSQTITAQIPVVTTQLFISGFTRPTDIQSAGDARLFVSENTGRIKIIENGAILSTPFLNISNKIAHPEWSGIQGFAFHPNYQVNGYFYVKYLRITDNAFMISRFTRNSYNQADATSEQVLLAVPNWGGHQGGSIAFGKDGFLYISTGDGAAGARGSIGDSFNNAQNLASVKGKLLRIDVDSGSSYGIPTSNPYQLPNDGIPDEIWARGLRNPWRMSFDRVTGDLWIGDNGQDGWEEVDFLANSTPGGANFGWRCYEGQHRYVHQVVCDDPTTMVFPVQEYAGYDNNGGQSASVMGGYVYRGGKFPVLYGNYVYGDYASGKIWTLKRNANGTVSNTLQSPVLSNVVSFGQDNVGELYAITFFEGAIYKIKAEPCPAYQILTIFDPIKDILTFDVGSNIKASNTIESQANVIYNAGTYIELKPGFNTAMGSVFRTQLTGCN